MREQSSTFSAILAIVVSIAFWMFMAGLAESDMGAMIGFTLAFGLAMVVGPFVALGPVGPLAGIAAAAAFLAGIRAH